MARNRAMEMSSRRHATRYKAIHLPTDFILRGNCLNVDLLIFTLEKLAWVQVKVCDLYLQEAKNLLCWKNSAEFQLCKLLLS